MSVPDQEATGTYFPGSRRWLALSLLGLSTLASLILGLYVQRGVAVTSDSMFYLTSAENLLRGEGLQWVGGGGVLHPLVHYPPAYPTLLAIFDALRFGLVQTATTLSIVLFGVTGALTGLLLFHATRSIVWAVLGGLGITLSPGLLPNFLYAQTEPMYLALLAGFTIAIHFYRLRPSFSGLLLLSLSGLLGYLTRYVGSTLIVLGVAGILLARGSRKQKLLHLGLFMVFTLLPVLFWIVRNYQWTGSFTNRVLGFHPLTLDQFKQGVSTLAYWFLPDSLSLQMRAGILVALFLPLAVPFLRQVTTAKSVRKLWDQIQSGDPSISLGLLVLLHILIYALALLISLTFFDASTRLDVRILAPIWLSVFLLLFAWSSRLRGVRRTYSGGLLLVFLVLNGWRSVDLLEQFRRDGEGYNGTAWLSSETLKAVQELAPSTVDSTEASALYFHTRIPAYWVPEKLDPVKNLPRPDYPRMMEEMRVRLTQPDAYLVVFWRSLQRVELPSLKEMTEGLELYVDTTDGAIYKLAAEANPLR